MVPQEGDRAPDGVPRAGQDVDHAAPEARSVLRPHAVLEHLLEVVLAVDTYAGPEAGDEGLLAGVASPLDLVEDRLDLVVVAVGAGLGQAVVEGLALGHLLPDLGGRVGQ